MSWPTVKLGDVCQFVRGPFGGALKKEFFTEDGYAVYEQQHAIYDQFENIRYFVDENKFNEMKRFELREGDLIMSCSGTMGKVAIVPAEIKKGIINQALLKLTPNKVLDLKFLKLYMESGLFQLQLNENTHGAAIKNVASVSILKDIEIPLPPLAEQKRIAAILDKADEIRRKREQTIAKLDQLAQSIFVEMFGHPALNTKNLPLISLGEVGKWKSGGTPARSNKEYFIGDINWFSSGELEQMYISNSAEKISKSALETTSASLVKKGSLMLGMYDTAALKSSIADIDCSCNQAIAFAEITNPCIDTIYVYLAIQFGKDHFKRLQRGVRQKNLNLEMIRQIKIPLPAINKQLEFVEIFKNIQHLKETKSNSLFIRNQLFASLQHQAFTGNL
jgi:type I restriction enzyme S subunit